MFLSLALALGLLLRNIVILRRCRSSRRGSRPGSGTLLPSKDAKAAAYEQEHRSAGNDTDEESLMMGYPVAYCGVVAGIGAAGAGGRGGRGCGARGREVLSVGHGDLLICGTAGVG